MNTAASSEKMNAWMNATRISSTHDEERHHERERRKRDLEPADIMKIRPMSARMITWPAIMFANKRIVSANGLVNFPTISTGVMMIVIELHAAAACRAASR